MSRSPRHQRIVIFLIVCLIIGPASIATAKDALLLIAHGSPDPTWNRTVTTVAKQVQDILLERADTRFSAVEVAFLEFAEPSVYTVVNRLADQGVTHFIAVPLFIAPSGHSVFDLPAVMSIYQDPIIQKTLAEEGTKVVDTPAGFTLGPTLHSSEVINQIMLARVREISVDADSEAVVLVCHGSRDFEPFWSRLCRRIGSYICGKTGITYYDYVFAGMGQAFFSQSYGTIARAAENRPRVLVVGLYMAHGADEIAAFALTRMKDAPGNPREVFEGIDVTFSPQGILPDPRVAEWVVETACAMAK